MTITQTIKIPADRRLTIDIPREIPTESVVLTFTPSLSSVSSVKKPRMTEAEEKELFRLHADELNREALDVLSYQVPLWDDEEET